MNGVHFHTASILGYDVYAGSVGSLMRQVEGWLIHHGQPKTFSCLNPHSLVVAESNAAFATALQRADILLPDGSGIVLAGRILGKPVERKIAGMDLFSAMCEEADKLGDVRFFFLGSTPETLNAIRENLASRYPGIVWAGSYSPPFCDEFSSQENSDMLERVNAAKADVLWVGMTAPKQEVWIEQNRHLLRVPVCGAVGAVFDFFAGTKKRSPEWAIRLGLEWLPRLMKEPRRMLRRNFVSTPKFLWRLASCCFAQRAAKRVRRP